MSHTQALHTSSRNNDQSIWLTSGRSLYLPAITYMTQLSASLSWQSLSQRDTFSFTFTSHINCQQVTRDSHYHNVTHSHSHLHHISTVSESLMTVTITTWHILICITYQLSASLSWQSLSQRDTFSFTFASHINCQQVSRDSHYHNVTHSRSHLHHISVFSYGDQILTNS